MQEHTSEDEVMVLIVCPACETQTRVNLEDACETVTRHNDQRHDGADIASIDPALKDEIARLVATDLELL